MADFTWEDHFGFEAEKWHRSYEFARNRHAELVEQDPNLAKMVEEAERLQTDILKRLRELLNPNIRTADRVWTQIPGPKVVKEECEMLLAFARFAESGGPGSKVTLGAQAGRDMARAIRAVCEAATRE